MGLLPLVPGEPGMVVPVGRGGPGSARLPPKVDCEGRVEGCSIEEAESLDSV